MAYQTALGILPGIRLERKDQLVSRRGLRVVALRGLLGIGMRLPRAVAHFATGDGIRSYWFDFSVVGFVKYLKFCPVTRAAAFRSHIGGAGNGRHGRYAHRRRLRRGRTPLAEGRKGEKKHREPGIEGSWPLHLFTPVLHAGHHRLISRTLLK